MGRSDEEIARIVRSEAHRMLDVVRVAREAGRRQGEGYDLSVPRLPLTANETLRMAELLEEALEDD